ncbi:MAG: hypothetical protein WAW17_03210 [Rhodococcus sp. (in: high G+C Gram-positive bacteria)]|uniref:hypothetical protein n=1 Tax=Rhodococcus sp. TaxID=1831 RepID=UPI003BAF83AA
MSRDGIIRVAELRQLGVSNSAVDSRCRPGEPWQRLPPGIVMLGNGHPTARQRAVAAVAYTGEGALLTGRAALHEYGYGSPASGDAHILIATHRRVQSTGFVLVEVIQRGGVTVAELRTELDAGSGRGSALPRAVLREVSADVHSVSEAEARRLWLRSGLPEMVFNRKVLDAGGQFIAMPDGWIDEVAFAWDIDSLDWHLSPKAYKSTVERRTRMQNHGIIVLPTLPSAVRDDPERVSADLRSHYRLAASRPRPDVRMLVPGG